MPQTIHQNDLPTPLQIAPGVIVRTVQELANALLLASDQQHAAKDIGDVDEQVDFLQACDTLNLSRMRWRLREETNDAEAVEAIVQRLRELVCQHRRYDDDEFGLALEATEQRARFPFGLDPLRFALLLAQKQPIRVLRPEVQDALSQQILGIAVQLQRINGTRSVLLPIEQLRTVLQCRKLVAGGAVRRLMKHNLLVEVGEKAHTGRAREFRVLAKEGTDYEFQNDARTEPKPPL